MASMSVPVASLSPALSLEAAAAAAPVSVDSRACAIRAFVEGGLAGFTGNMPEKVVKYAEQIGHEAYGFPGWSLDLAIERECALVVKSASEEEFGQKCKDLADPEKIALATQARLKEETTAYKELIRKRDFLYKGENSPYARYNAASSKESRQLSKASILFNEATHRLAQANSALEAFDSEAMATRPEEYEKAKKEYLEASAAEQNATKMLCAVRATWQIAQDDAHAVNKEVFRLNKEIKKIEDFLGIASLDDIPKIDIHRIEAAIAAENQATITWLQKLRNS